MAALDILLLLCAIFGAVALLRPPQRWLLWCYALVALALLGTEIALHGLHWQLFPVDAVILLCAVLLPVRRPAAPGVGVRVLASLGLLACVASLGMALVLPLFHLPAPTGPYAVGTRTEDWTDPATGRELVVQLWYPAAPQADNRRAPYMRAAETKPMFRYWAALPTNSWQDAPVAAAPASSGGFPVLLFGHMWGGRRTQDTYVNEDLASHGFVVAAVDHPGNAARVQLGTGAVLRSDRADALSNVEAAGFAGIRKVWADELALWTADNEFVLNSLQSGRESALAGRVDWTRVGAFGHSFGGSASVALLGLDPRVKSAIDLDGWTFEGLNHRTTQPVLFVYEARDAGLAGGLPTGPSVDDRLERSDRELVDHSLQTGGGFRAYVGGTQHADFTDAVLESPLQRLTWTGPIRPVRAETITRGLVLGFFNQTLKGEGSGPPAYPEVRMETRPAAPAQTVASR